jgi:hypothetical protein
MLVLLVLPEGRGTRRDRQEGEEDGGVPGLNRHF